MAVDMEVIDEMTQRRMACAGERYIEAISGGFAIMRRRPDGGIVWCVRNGRLDARSGCDQRGCSVYKTLRGAIAARNRLINEAW